MQVVKYLLLFAVLTDVIAVGCTETNEATAPSKTSERPKPGFVRLLNLNSDHVAMFDHSRVLDSPVVTDEGSRFTTFPCGPRSIRIKGQSVDLNMPIDLKSGTYMTIVLGVNGKSLSKISDVGAPENGHNVKLFYLDETGAQQFNGPPLTVRCSGTSILLSASEAAISVPQGSWRVEAKGLDDKKTLEVLPDCMYDLMVINDRRAHYVEVTLFNKVEEKARIANTPSN